MDKRLSEWFDPYSEEHVLAFRYLQTFGMWPEGFIPDYIDIEPGWQINIFYKLAETWIEEVINKKH